jgi:hypothetical protein
MFRFTIRDVLWLPVVVGLAVGWGITVSRMRNRQLEFRAEGMEYALTEEGFTIEQPTPSHVIVAKPGQHYEVTRGWASPLHRWPPDTETIIVR